jgi:hypothetical protein
LRSACRIAGRLGCGGGPFGFFPPWHGRKPLVLQEAECDERHQRVPMQPAPRAAFKVVKAQLLFELLMRLLAHPTCFDD